MLNIASPQLPNMLYFQYTFIVKTHLKDFTLIRIEIYFWNGSKINHQVHLLLRIIGWRDVSILFLRSWDCVILSYQFMWSLMAFVTKPESSTERLMLRKKTSFSSELHTQPAQTLAFYCKVLKTSSSLRTNSKIDKNENVHKIFMERKQYN